MSAKLSYAFHEPTSRYIYIKDAENGLKCNCRCEKCKERLEAIQGNQRDQHFRHYIKTDCGGAPETAIHKYAKQIIAEHSEIQAVGCKIKYSHPRIEKRLENKITPDITVCVNDSDTYFEIKSKPCFYPE